jgi:hypothetical protein
MWFIASAKKQPMRKWFDMHNVSLHVAGELNLANDAHRQLNDVAALKLRKAMLETFSSLLDYPLISEDRNHQQWFFG